MLVLFAFLLSLFSAVSETAPPPPHDSLFFDIILRCGTGVSFGTLADNWEGFLFSISY